jgi:hypothetical protein
MLGGAVMRSGQLTLNDFETAILRQISHDNPKVLKTISDLQVLSREFTGAGSYTTFRRAKQSDRRTHVGLDVLIEMPGVPNGMGAVLFLVESMPAELEIYTYGGDSWDGQFDGFALVATP